VGRQSSLLSASGAGRTAFAQSLEHLIDLGLVERNTGHGHPLRPEYCLTQNGAEVAKIASKIKSAVPQLPERALLRRAWTVPILAVSHKPLYFTDIKKQLGSITDRALSQSLERLHGQNWFIRTVNRTNRPPRALYQAVNAGAMISQAVGLRAVEKG